MSPGFPTEENPLDQKFPILQLPKTEMLLVPRVGQR